MANKKGKARVVHLRNGVAADMTVTAVDGKIDMEIEFFEGGNSVMVLRGSIMPLHAARIIEAITDTLDEANEQGPSQKGGA